MNRPQAWLPLVLILVFAVCLGLIWNDPDVSHSSKAQSSGSDGNEVPGVVPDAHGPIPAVDVAGTQDQPVMPSRPMLADASPEAAKLLSERMRRDTDGMQVITHADGRRSVNLAGRFTHMSTIIPGKDGKPEVRCFTDFQKMADATSGSLTDEEPRVAPHVR